MTEQLKIQMKIISLLLQYPDEGLRRSLPSFEACVEHLPHSSARDKLVQFISYLRATPLLRLQETYTETFDLDPSTCLNLTYHLLGDGEKRGNIMAGLQQIYFEAGYETIAGELPDYLPLMLEFLSECPDSCGTGMLWSYLGSVEKPAGCLRNSGNPYSLLLDVVGDIVREEGRRPEDRGRRSEVGRRLED
ncbi:MAG: nitrate reductase molybdenum cofactor assembly chaperone [Desulfobacterales bacterium]